MSDLSVLDSIKHKDISEIILELDRLYNDKSINIDKIKSLILNEQNNSIFNLNTDDKKLTYILLLGIIYDSLSSNLYFSDIFESLNNKLVQICKYYDINIQDVAKLSRFAIQAKNLNN